MSPKLGWFLTFLFRSAAQRKGRIAIAGLAVTLAVGVVTGMTTLSLGMRYKMGEELKAYGANIIVTADAASHDLLPEDYLSRVRGMTDAVESATAQIYGNLRLEGTPVETMGVMFHDLADRGWKLKGRWPDKSDEIVLGTVLADAAGLSNDSRVSLEWEDGVSRSYSVSGILDRGGSEDHAVLMNIEEARKALGLEPGYGTLFIRSRGPAESAVQEMSRNLKGARIRSLKQVAEAEAEILRKIELLMLLVTVVVLAGSVIAVGSTMGATVLERRQEIGLERALGASRPGVSLFFAAEAALIGFIGGAAGAVLGAVSAELVTRGAFDSWIQIPLWIPAAGIIMGMLLAIMSGHPPVRSAMKVPVSEILRGE